MARARGVALVSVFAIGAVVIAGCSADEAPAPTASADVNVAEPEPTSEVSATEEPVVAAIATVPLELEHRDGYKASVTLDWLPLRTATAEAIPAACLEWVRGTKAVDVENSVFTLVPARLTFDFPTSEGFTWPADQPTLWGFDAGVHDDSVVNCSPDFTTTSGPSDSISVPSIPGTWEIYGILVAEKTPNNPEGTPEISPADVEVNVGSNTVTCLPDNCAFVRYPG